MIIGNPFMFAILVERVAEWNDSEAEDNGHFAFCIKGEVFPKGIITQKQKLCITLEVYES